MTRRGQGRKMNVLKFMEYEEKGVGGETEMFFASILVIATELCVHFYFLFFANSWGVLRSMSPPVGCGRNKKIPLFFF